jgi:hypothetical protein
MMRARRTRRAVASGVVLLGLLAGAVPARAGGSWLYPVADRYEPGDVATLVGYAGPGQQGWLEDGPFYAYLEPAAGDRPPSAQDGGQPLGPLTVEPTGRAGWEALRITLSFRLPIDLAAGSYQVMYCNDPCAKGLGDLVGAMVDVGVDPSGPVIREWSLDEPEIANLAPDAVVSGPGYRATAHDIRSGDITRFVDPPPASDLPAPAPAASAPPASAPPASAPPTLAAERRSPGAGSAGAVNAPQEADGGQAGANLGFLLLGGGIALVCTASVLLALRSGRRRARGVAGEDLGPAVAGRRGPHAVSRSA